MLGTADPPRLSPSTAQQIDEFLRHHLKQLAHGITRHSGLRPQDRDDVLSDAMLGLCLAQARIAPSRPLFPLAYTIALRKGSTKLKRLAAAASRTSPLPDDAEEPHPSGEAQAIADERREAVQRFLGGLHPTDRRILEARHYDDLTWDGVANAVGLPKTSVIRRYRNIIAEARQALFAWAS